jgi:hypothetical protein
VRILFTVLLCVVEPLWFALDLHVALPRLVAEGAPALAIVVGRILVTGWGVAAGVGLARNDPDAFPLGRFWALSSMLIAVAVYATPFWPTTAPPSIERLELMMRLSSCLVCYGCFVWLARRSA